MTEKCPVLILGNKIDIPSAASEEQIKEYFNLYSHTTGKKNVSETQFIAYCMTSWKYEALRPYEMRVQTANMHVTNLHRIKHSVAILAPNINLIRIGTVLC